ARHHDVEDDQVEGARLQCASKLLAAIRLADPHPVLGEIARERVADVGGVIDDEDMGRGLHFPALCRLAARTTRQKCNCLYRAPRRTTNPYKVAQSRETFATSPAYLGLAFQPGRFPRTEK